MTNNRKIPKKRNFLYHIHPPSISENVLRPTHTWGLGGSALVLVLMQVITGILLLFVYSSEMSKAYDSIRMLQQEVLFGRLIRNLHHWGANLLIVIVFFHMLRVFFTGAYHNQRNTNWWIGLGLFLCVMISNFTGYLLPMDQLSFWAITICASMFEYIPYVGQPVREMILGGPDISQATLSNFYAIHIALVPVALMILLPFHFWRVRKAGGVVEPVGLNGKDEEKQKKLATVPHLVTREVTAALVLIAGLMIVSVFMNAPLYGQANPGLSPNPTKAPWYFSGLQELLQHFHPFFAVFIIPLFLVLWLTYLPFLKSANSGGGTWFLSANGRKTGIAALCTSLTLIPLMIIADEHASLFLYWFPEISPTVTDGVIPFVLVLAFILFFYGWIKRRFTATTDECIQAICIFLLVTFMVLTIAGIWFRGSGMALCWPWEVSINEIATIKRL
ncbi:MAG: cytochrome bc complex cytochrome b subunit [Desulfobacteraceae bacterium]|nr:cytochrome bc complex cytochrome b subunit [Desulfobacteraceae bacterium]